ncbi:hypothetical protein TKK_0009473 [Trichogramma kaykai]
MSKSRAKCVFQGCGKSAQDDDVTLHRFKTKPTSLRDDWIARSGNASLAALTEAQLGERRVCSAHFLDTDFRFVGVNNKKELNPGVKPKFFYELENRNPPVLQLDEVPQQLDEVAQVPKMILLIFQFLIHVCRISAYPSIASQGKKIKTLNQKINRDKKRVIKLTEKDLIIGASNYIYGRNLDFFKMQLNHSKRRICEEDEKQFALGLYYKSPKAYKYLSDIFNLPCSTTIHEWVNNINLRPGEKNIQLHKQLQVKLKLKSFYEKQSVLMWDEMMIKPGLEFSSKYDILEGYEDLRSDVGGRSPKIATHVLVFMLGGLIHNWKQPFFYIPSAGPVSASNLIILINKVLELAFEVGFIIKHMVCDQSKGNQNPSYTFNENKITFGFDVPHIIKCIRNNLI